VVHFINKITHEITPLNPSLPPFTKGRRKFPPLSKGGEGGFFCEGFWNAIQKYVTKFMKSELGRKGNGDKRSGHRDKEEGAIHDAEGFTGVFGVTQRRGA
jgi:hypothetical protein